MKKTILIGAGAEIGFGLSGGRDFARALLSVDYIDNLDEKQQLFNKKLDDMNAAIANFYTKYKIDWYPKFRKGNFDIDKFLKACLKKKTLLLSEVEFEKKGEFNTAIEDVINKMTSDDKEKLMNDYPSYMGLIDEYFHTFINPKYLGPNKFWMTVSLFTRAYLLLVEQILDDGKTYEEILVNPKETIDCVEKRVAAMLKKTSYYYEIKKYCCQNIDNLTGVITTNYTPFCKFIDDRLQVSYLHGQLGMFESAKKLKIYGVSELDQANKIIKDKSDMLFPFLTVQSGIKPIVCASQINEYEEMLKILRASAVLIVLGYEFNIDDNHINGIINEWLEKEKHIMIYLKYVEDETQIAEEVKLTEKKLKKIFSLDDLEFCKRIQVELLIGENSVKKFSEILNSK